MRIISVKTIKDFWENDKYRDSEQPLKSWYHEAKQAKWKSPNEIKSKYRSASILNNNRAVFNIKGNRYRLVVAVNYHFQIIFIRFIGTHKEYDKINAQNI
ncbi:MAG: type II toxin-antitoxin system HigB family toxin [Candidatus Paceibacterota bacterium]